MLFRNLSAALTHLFKIVTWTENALLITMLGLMVGLAAAQIVFRNFLDISIHGADQMLRLLVLWVAYLGAVAASREGKHIHVDAITRWLPGHIKAGVIATTDLFTLSVCLLLAWQALRFLQSARESGEMAFGSLPVWVAGLILPLAFTLIALRYSIRFVHHVQQARDREELPE
jgi:TRAP-type C4-dicarboxylate transport system permease small subunit